MGEFDMPVILGDKFFGKVGSVGAGFNSGVDVGAEEGDEVKDGFRIVGNGLIRENRPFVIRDTD